MTLKQAIERAGDICHTRYRDVAKTIQLKVGDPLSFTVSRAYDSEDQLMKALTKDDPGSQAVALPEDKFVRTPPVGGQRKKKARKGKQMNIEKRCLQAIDSSTVQKVGLHRGHFAAALEHRARRKGGMEQALKSENGRKLYFAYEAAPPEPLEVKKSNSQRCAADEVEAKTNKLMHKNSSLTRDQARDSVLDNDPELERRYAKEVEGPSSGSPVDLPNRSGDDMNRRRENSPASGMYA